MAARRVTNITYHQDKVLGQGSFGSVYGCVDDYGGQLALKKVPHSEEGISNPLEISIMSTYNHPHLARAEYISTKGAPESATYIVQQPAICDLAKYTRKKNLGHILSIEQLRKFCYQLTLAVYYLHSNKIIHADIKASNVLLFPGEIVKLCDYSLSVCYWTDEDYFQHQVCTGTHRPMECIRREVWSYPLDIWSLGCTFYEMAYGHLFLPDQSRGNRMMKLDAMQRLVTLAHLDWAKRNPLGAEDTIVNETDKPGTSVTTSFSASVTTSFSASPATSFSATPGFTALQSSVVSELPLPPPPIAFVPVVIPPPREEYKLFEDLIFRMLRVNAHLRPTALQILGHPFFAGMAFVGGDVISTPAVAIPRSDRAKLERCVERWRSLNVGLSTEIDTDIMRRTFELYARCPTLVMNSRHKAAGCLWIVSKLVNNGTPAIIDIDKAQCIAVEALICNHLGYRLHVAAPPLAQRTAGLAAPSQQEMKSGGGPPLTVPGALAAPAGGDRPATALTPAGGDRPATALTPAGGDRLATALTPAGGDRPATALTPAGGDRTATALTPAGGDRLATALTPAGGDRLATALTPVTVLAPATPVAGLAPSLARLLAVPPAQREMKSLLPPSGGTPPPVHRPGPTAPHMPSLWRDHPPGPVRLSSYCARHGSAYL